MTRQNGKETFSKKVNVEMECEFTDRLDLYLHEGVANGEYEGKPFRLITTGHIFRLEYDDKCLIIETKDLVSLLMDKIIEEIEKL